MLDKKSTFQINQYDVTQQIIETLANVYSRAVLFCIIDKAKDAQTIADDQKMSISTELPTEIVSNSEICFSSICLGLVLNISLYLPLELAPE